MKIEVFHAKIIELSYLNVPRKEGSHNMDNRGRFAADGLVLAQDVGIC